MSGNRHCPNCLQGDLTVFYEVREVPVNSVLLLTSKEAALAYPKRDIGLGFCDVCGFVSNLLFDAALPDYSTNYEATQAFSPTFNRFHQRLAQGLIDRYQLHHKTVLEIGCGQGEFLQLLCELGHNSGLGFDPAYYGEPTLSLPTGDIHFIKDYYSEKYLDHEADFVCCKMTLEHIPDTADFVGNVRRAVGDQEDTVIFFQIPNLAHIVNQTAFWDIYYEHCSYFSPDSLAYLFNAQGFTVIDLWSDYDDQYLMIEARPSLKPVQPITGLAAQVAQWRAKLDHFAQDCQQRINHWQTVLNDIAQRKERVVIWGSGSKAVSFLTALDNHAQVAHTIDINPRKHGTFMAGTGQEIKAPSFLKSYKPDVVIVMNPVYCDEIRNDLSEMGLMPKLMSV